MRKRLYESPFNTTFPLQLPTQSNPFYWQYAEHEQFFDADSIAMMGHIGRGWDRGGAGVGGAGGGAEDARKAENYVKTKGDAMTLLELECNQTFLGMVQMQYQAVVDIVQLIDLLEKACIRSGFRGDFANLKSSQMSQGKWERFRAGSSTSAATTSYARGCSPRKWAWRAAGTATYR